MWYHWHPDLCCWPVGLLIKWGLCFWASPKSNHLSRISPPLELNQIRWRHFQEPPFTPHQTHPPPPLLQAPPPFCALPLSISSSDVRLFPVPGCALFWPLYVNWTRSEHPLGYSRGEGFWGTGFDLWRVCVFFFFYTHGFVHTLHSINCNCWE